MPPVLRSSRLPPEATAVSTRPKRHRGSENQCRKRRSKITRRRRSIDLSVWEAVPEDRFEATVSTSSHLSSFPLRFAALNGIFFPMSVKRKPRSSCRRASRKKLPRSCTKEPEAANSSTSGVEVANVDVSGWIRGDALEEEFGFGNFMKTTDEAAISTSKFDGSCIEICEGSNSLKPEVVCMRGRISPENPTDNGKDSPEICDTLSATFHEKAPEACVSELTIEAEAEGLPHDLACSEQFSCSDYENPDGDRQFSNRFQTRAFSNSSLRSFSDFSPIFFESSADEFSEEQGEAVHSSACFLLFLEYSKEFCRSESEEGQSSTHAVKIGHTDDFRMFEDDEDEQTYSKLRFRERGNSCRHRYAEQQTEQGEVLCSQRLSLVNWIVEHCTSRNLQMETIFLSVSLLDRFLCRGSFKRGSRLEILGIACATLATRIEENQPLNSIRNEEFQIGDSLYRRCEVVAMEWVILDVLEYKCFSPTTFNFLWFYLKAAKADEELERHVKVLAISSLSHHEMLYFWPSTVAAGLVVQACSAKGQRSAVERVFETHVRSKEDLNDLEGCIKSIGSSDKPSP
ncbi:unnamed protein product [Victoria cruziana]